VRSIVVVGFIAIAATLSACASNNNPPLQLAAMRTSADNVAIEQLELTWHKASTIKDVDMNMSVWADNAVWTIGGHTFVGKSEIRKFLATTAAPFRPENHWISETPIFKDKITVSGDHGTLYFECHYADVKTRRVKLALALDAKVARIDGHWLITNAVTEAASLK